MLRDAGSDYLQWIIGLREGGLKLDLTNSGMQTPLGRLEVPPGAADACQPAWGGDPAIRARLASRYGVPSEEVVTTLGTSMAVFLAGSAVLAPGDGVLVEDPAYDPLWKVPEALGARVGRFSRRPEAGWALEPERILDLCDPGTRMVSLSDLHNPTARMANDEALATLARELDLRGMVLFVDEVYRDFRPGPVGTARRLGGNVIVASSLTKVYGLGGLRAGWMFASPEMVRRIKSLLSILEVADPAPVIPYFTRGLEMADLLRREALDAAALGRSVLKAWDPGESGIEAVAAHGGIHAWFRLPQGVGGTEVARRLLDQHRTAVVPGAMFGDDDGLRVCVGGSPELTRIGLEQVVGVVSELRPG